MTAVAAGPAQLPREVSDVESALDRLRAIPPGRYQVLSCYLRLEAADRARQRYRLHLTDHVKQVRATAQASPLPRAERLAVERDLDRIEACVANPRDLPHARGLAIFACEALELFVTVPLAQVRRLMLILDDTPWIHELVAAARASAPIMAAAIDRRHVRFFEVRPFSVRELPPLRPVAGRGGKFHGDRRDAPGVGERAYHGRRQEEKHREYADAAARLEAMLHGAPARGVVLVGPRQHTAALERFLPRDVASHLLGVTALNPRAVTLAQMQATVLAVAEWHDREEVARQVRGLGEALGDGWAVSGLRDTLRALGRGQVRTLFVARDAAQPGFRCDGTDRLVLDPSACRGKGAPRPVHDVVDEAVEDALGQGVEVVPVDDPAPCRAIEGMSAVLRFR